MCAKINNDTFHFPLSISVLLPMKAPYILIDKLLYADERIARTQYVVRENFVQNGIFQVGGLIENMAQTCAAKTGYITWLNKLPIQVGVIGGIKNLKINFLPKKDDILITEVCLKAELFDLTLMEAKICCNQQTIAEGELKVALI